METKYKILVVGRNPHMMAAVLETLRAEGYQALGASTVEEALAHFSIGGFDGVIIGRGVDGASRSLLHASLLEHDPAIQIFDIGPDQVIATLQSHFPLPKTNSES
jgi:DNA-binding NtrC family response regulator